MPDSFRTCIFFFCHGRFVTRPNSTSPFPLHSTPLHPHTHPHTHTTNHKQQHQQKKRRKNGTKSIIRKPDRGRRVRTVNKQVLFSSAWGEWGVLFVTNPFPLLLLFLPSLLSLFLFLLPSLARSHERETNKHSRIFESALSDLIPVIHTTIAGTRLVGCLTIGNANGLLLPHNTTDQELQHIRNSLPDEIKVQRIEERLSALGNIIACNDHVALVHPDIERETEEIVADVLGVEVFR